MAAAAMLAGGHRASCTRCRARSWADLTPARGCKPEDAAAVVADLAAYVVGLVAHWQQRAPVQTLEQCMFVIAHVLTPGARLAAPEEAFAVMALLPRTLSSVTIVSVASSDCLRV